ncbi:MAG: VOC family protein [Candidatus Thermoplasmatota archaeon]|nr:VOC family protein [Candidatus Thermoplasmatota archaeon]
MVGTLLNHVALQCDNGKKAEIFFTKVLEIPLERSFDIPAKLSNAIFGINEDVDVQVYDNRKTRFEIFVTKKTKEKSFVHTCIEVDDKNKFISRCKDNGIEPIVVKKREKTLLFVKDYSGNLFEIK